MKLLFFIHSLSAGGAERVTSTLANYWARKGWDVTIVTITGLQQNFYTTHHTIRHIALSLDVASKGTFHAIVNNVLRARALRCVLKELKPDVAIAMMSTANCLLAWAGKGTGIPLVGSERVHPPMWPLGKVWEVLRRWSYPRLDAMVAQTALTAEWLSHYAPSKRIRIIPNPVTYPLLNHEPIIPIHSIIQNLDNRHILLAIGRLEPQKGFDRLLQVFARICEKNSDWVLVILGEGSQRKILMELAGKYAIQDRLYLPGSVGNISDWLVEAELFVLTSRFEGFPNTLLEALAYGLPVVAVDCETGPRDILHHEEYGLLVPQGDDESLEYALRRLMKDKVLRKQYAGRATEVRQRYSLERIADKWEHLFIEVMSG
jgi:glycosyltransferase involved in cell wall biosynthesis